MARLFTSLGIPCGHESIFDFQGLEHATKIINGEANPSLSETSTTHWIDGQKMFEPNWLADLSKIQAESSYMAAPYLHDSILSRTKIIHVVRNPIKVVNSFCNYINYFKDSEPSTSFEEFIYDNIPELKKPMSQYERAALYYVRWNELIEKRKCDLFHKVENGTDAVMNFLQIISDQPYSNTKVNTYKKWSNEQFYIHLIRSKEIRDAFVSIGHRYGYKMPVQMFM
jgi:hypothetical protein